MARTSLYAAIIVCIYSDPCLAYRLVGSESLSDALVAHHYTINDRLDAVIVVDPTIPTFEYQTFYAMGHADEPEGEQGKLHFLEHIIAGTGSHPRGKLSELIIRNGGQHLAYTGHHMTYFTMRFPRDKLALAIEIDRDRFYRTIIDQENVEHERKAVLTEHSRRISNWKNRFTNRFWGLVYGRESFEAVGTESFIKEIEPGDLKQLFHNVLRRKRRLVVVIGDVVVDDVLEKLAEAFPDRENHLGNATIVELFPNPEALGETYHVEFENLNTSLFNKAWKIPRIGHPDYAGLVVLASILVRPSSSLRTSLLDSQIVSKFSVWVSSLRGFGLLRINAEMPPVTSIKAVEKAISETLGEIEKHGVTENDLEAARNTQLRHQYSVYYDRADLAYGFAEAFVLTGDPHRYPRLIRQIQRVNVDDIQRIVGEHLIDAKSISLSWTQKKKHPLWAQIVAGVALIFAFGVIVFIIIWAVRKAIRRFAGKAVYNEQPPENLT